MNKLFFFTLLLIVFDSKGQAPNDTANLSISFTTYLLPENSVYPNGCIAIGPSFFLNDNKLSIQIGLFFNTKINYITEYNKSPYPNTPEKVPHLFFPIGLHYNFYTRGKFDFILSGGIIFEARPEKYKIERYTNVMLGYGFKYRLVKNFYFKATPVFQGDSFGLFLDLAYSFNVINYHK